jgi:hypothetical protein
MTTASLRVECKSMEHNDNEGETEMLGIKPDRGPHSLPQITHGRFSIENFLPRFRSTIFMRTEVSFMIACKPDVSAELVLGLFAFASLFPASQFENPYYFK